MGSPAYNLPPHPPGPPDDTRERLAILETSFAWFRYEMTEKIEAIRAQLAEQSRLLSLLQQSPSTPAPEPVNAAVTKVLLGLMTVFSTLALTGSVEKAREIGLKLLMVH